MQRRDEAGVTLVEVLVTVIVLGVALLIFVGGIGTSVFASDQHRKEATTETVLRTYAEAVKAAAYDGTCGTSLSSATGGTAPTGFVKATPVVKAWNGTVFVACPTADTKGLQLVTLGVSSVDNRVAERIDVVKRQP
jgi:type II secretory pathway pseudopilin PulG